MNGTREGRRLADGHAGRAAWLRWGPYLADRQWGTVREDDSSNGDPWHAFTHDQARSRAYRWGEDGIAGLTDDGARLCFSLALWNGVDPIVKERLFGLANDEGNHGEDVKELYWYLDATPTHSWARMRYRYPQRAYPYDDLVRINGARSRQEPEYEIWDTGVFDDRRFFDVDVDYAKASPDDILIRVTVHNRGPEAAELHLLPMLWFRNTWAGAPDWAPPQARPSLRAESGGSVASLVAEHVDLGRRRLLVEGPVSWLVTENETNTERLWGIPNASAYVRDGINDAVVHGRTEAVNPAGTGTRAAAHRVVSVPAGRSVVMRLRLTADDPSTAPWAATGPFGEPPSRVRGRRLLRLDHAAVGERRARLDPAPGPRGDAVVQAALLARHGALAGVPPGGRQRRSALAAAQRGLESPHQRRGDLHARYLGVPVVRGVGPGDPHGGAGHGGPGLRPRAAGPHAP